LVAAPVALPVTVTVYVPTAVPVQLRVEVPEPPEGTVMLVGANEQVKPVLGDGLAERATDPLKPPRSEAVMIEVPAAVALTLTLVGLAVKPKTGTTVIVRVVEFMIAPLNPPDPVIVIV
jgi:hypothetical protein